MGRGIIRRIVDMTEQELEAKQIAEAQARVDTFAGFLIDTYNLSGRIQADLADSEPASINEGVRREVEREVAVTRYDEGARFGITYSFTEILEHADSRSSITPDLEREILLQIKDGIVDFGNSTVDDKPLTTLADLELVAGLGEEVIDQLEQRGYPSLRRRI